MFNINDVVIHKSQGALVIRDILTKDFGLGSQTYYYLTPKFVNNINNSLELYLPTATADDYIRKPITKEKVNQLILAIPSMEKIWVNDARKRKMKFEEIYYSGDIHGLCQLVKLLYIEDEFFEKPMSLTDRNFLKKVRNNMFDEFAVALDILPDEVEKHIVTNLGQE